MHADGQCGEVSVRGGLSESCSVLPVVELLRGISQVPRDLEPGHRPLKLRDEDLQLGHQIGSGKGIRFQVPGHFEDTLS